MLKAYCDISTINSIDRSYLIDLIKPLFPEKSLNKYGITKEYIVLVDNGEDAAICIASCLPN